MTDLTPLLATLDTALPHKEPHSAAGRPLKYGRSITKWERYQIRLLRIEGKTDDEIRDWLKNQINVFDR